MIDAPDPPFTMPRSSRSVALRALVLAAALAGCGGGSSSKLPTSGAAGRTGVAGAGASGGAGAAGTSSTGGSSGTTTATGAAGAAGNSSDADASTAGHPSPPDAATDRPAPPPDGSGSGGAPSMPPPDGGVANGAALPRLVAYVNCTCGFGAGTQGTTCLGMPDPTVNQVKLWEDAGQSPITHYVVSFLSFKGLDVQSDPGGIWQNGGGSATDFALDPGLRAALLSARAHGKKIMLSLGGEAGSSGFLAWWSAQGAGTAARVAGMRAKIAAAVDTFQRQNLLDGDATPWTLARLDQDCIRAGGGPRLDYFGIQYYNAGQAECCGGGADAPSMIGSTAQNYVNLANGWPAPGNLADPANAWHQYQYFPGPWAAFAGIGADRLVLGKPGCQGCAGSNYLSLDDMKALLARLDGKLDKPMGGVLFWDLCRLFGDRGTQCV